MDETIRIRAVDKSDWDKNLQGFQAEQLKQLFAVYGVEGKVIGNICESLEGKYYINGKPEVDYPSLQMAAGTLLKSKGSTP
ncbi:hypothetical protein [Lyngbya aestuarii]|uniref:hypothetical protein n=1 Tax=Lyngbya aestuarii TaxID=118322 RepID=UPI00403DD2D3